MTSALEQSIAELLRASRRDEDVLAFPIDGANFGLHAQQAGEKLLKALIASHAVKFKRTHDLALLFAELDALQENVPTVALELVWLTRFAGDWRYQDVAEIAVEEREHVRTTLAELRLWVVGRIAERLPSVRV